MELLLLSSVEPELGLSFSKAIHAFRANDAMIDNGHAHNLASFN